MNERWITDEKGERHSHCHGVTANEWFDTVRMATINLSDPEWRTANGISRLAPSTLRCTDPDCRRLNRRLKHDRPLPALYVIMRDIEPVHPFDPTNEADYSLCNGHPWKTGGLLCRQCAIMATTKRLIDQRRAQNVQQRREMEGGATGT